MCPRPVDARGDPSTTWRPTNAEDIAMHVLEAALAANLRPHPLALARSGQAEWPADAGALVRLSAVLLSIGAFALSLSAASIGGPEGSTIRAETETVTFR
jgi:hypothetical protein